MNDRAGKFRNSEGRRAFDDYPGLIADIEAGLETPPVGLIMIELMVDAHSSVEWSDRNSLSNILGDCLGDLLNPTDVVHASDPQRVAIVKRGLTSSGEAEGFAYRLQECVSVAAQQRVHLKDMAIGVAVSRTGDSAVELARYARHALEDAKTLARTVVIFDDQDRELLI